MNYIKIICAFSLFLFISCKKETKKRESHSEYREEKQIQKITGCGYNSIIEITPVFLPGEERVLQIIESILSYTGLAPNFEVFRYDYSDNAFATIYNDKRLILYDPKLFNDVDQYSKTYWTSLSIIAHEIGHHLNGHTLDNIGSNHVDELEADKFSGFIMYKMGATFEQAQMAMKILSPIHGSQTHPPLSDRLNSIAEGWNDANYLQFNSAIPPEPNNAYLFEDYYIEREQFLNFENTQIDDYNQLIHLSPTYEAIITNVSPYGHEKVQYNYDIPTNLELKILITKIENDHKYYNYQTNEKANLLVINWPASMHNANQSNFPSILAPGMKIRFRVIQFSRTEYQILDLKVLRR